MSDQEAIEQLQAQLVARRRALAILRQQVAVHGEANAPPGQLAGIAEAEAAIRTLEDALRSAGGIAVVESIGAAAAIAGLDRRVEDNRQRADARADRTEESIRDLADRTEASIRELGRALVDARNADDARTAVDAAERAKRQAESDVWRTQFVADVTAIAKELAKLANEVRPPLARIKYAAYGVAIAAGLGVFAAVVVLIDRMWMR